MVPRGARRRATTTVLLVGTAVALAPTGVAASPRPLPRTTVFGFTGAVETWTVPDDVCRISILAEGAQGGAGSSALGQSGQPMPDDRRLPGGAGGRSEVTVRVAPGETLTVRVGGPGGDGRWDGTSTEGGTGGWNGGGDGGSGGRDGGGGGGGGGGASDVRRGGDTAMDRIVVAGGGGGSGAWSSLEAPPYATGGDGGDPASGGGDGTDPDRFITGEPAAAGAGGTTGAPGVGGAGGRITGSTDPDDGVAANGADGVGPTGGAGGSAAAHRSGGGGGGGGRFGGGGGGAAAWGVGAGGGGGSSLGDTTTPGTRHGGGLVTITPVGSCAGDEPTTAPTTGHLGTDTPGTVGSRAAGAATAVVGRPAYTG